MNSYLLLLLLVLTSLCVGLVAGITAKEPIVAPLVGISLATIMTILVKADKHKWLISVLVALSFAVSVLLCYPFGFIYTLLTICLGLLIATFALRHIYLVDMPTALSYLFKVLFGKPVAKLTVSEPTKIVDHGPQSDLGPMTITVKPNTAILLEAGSRQTQIAGPSTYISKPFEYVKRIYSLKPHHDVFKFPKVLTNDLISTKVALGLTYGLDVAWEARKGSANSCRRKKRQFDYLDLVPITGMTNCTARSKR